MIIDKNDELISKIYKTVDSNNISDRDLLDHLKKRTELKDIEENKIKESLRLIRALKDN